MDDLKLKFSTAIIALLLALASSAQEVMRMDTIKIDTASFDNIKVMKFHSDEKSSTFVIWVKDSVRPHKHAEHTENIYVLEGSGLFTLGNDQFPIDPGHHIVIPKGTSHSVQVLSDDPMKVISIQSPEFHGNDRIFIDEKK